MQCRAAAGPRAHDVLDDCDDDDDDDADDDDEDEDDDDDDDDDAGDGQGCGQAAAAPAQWAGDAARLLRDGAGAGAGPARGHSPRQAQEPLGQGGGI